jgi:hypothetical protein
LGISIFFLSSPTQTSNRNNEDDHQPVNTWGLRAVWVNSAVKDADAGWWHRPLRPVDGFISNAR